MAKNVDKVLLLLLVVSLGFNVFLGARDTPLFAKQQKYDSTKLSGRPAAALTLKTLSGGTVEVPTTDGPTLIYVVRPGCDWCEKNTAAINALWAQRKGQYRFVGVSLQEKDLVSYLKLHSLPFDVHVLADYRNEALSAYGFGATPALYLVSDGKISRAWGGAFLGATKEDAERFFRVTLPEVPKGLPPL